MVEADQSKCQGYGTCVLIGPDVFSLSDIGKVVIDPVTVTAADPVMLDTAIRCCPASALTRVE